MRLQVLNHQFDRRAAGAVSSMVVFFAVAISAQANLVVNGSFEQTLKPGSFEIGSRYPSQQLTGWTTSSYSFVFESGAADTTGAIGEYGGVKMWGPGDGSNNGFTASSPDGGNFLAMDGAYASLPLSQTINNLTPGEAVNVSFYWAGAQQKNFNGATTEQFKVSLGNTSQWTEVLQNANHGFTGWRETTFSFVPQATSEVLSFMAIGTPSGVPPFSLLDGVSVTSAPEPGTWGLLVSGAAALAIAARRRHAKKTARDRSL